MAGDPILVNGTLRTVLEANGNDRSVNINGTGVELSSDCNHPSERTCIVIKADGLRLTIDETFSAGDATKVDVKVTLPPNSYAHDFRRGDLVIVSDHASELGKLYSIFSEPKDAKNMTFAPVGGTVGEGSGYATRVASSLRTIKSISTANPAVVTFNVEGDYDTHGFTRGDLLTLVNVQGTPQYSGKVLMVAGTTKSTIALSGIDGATYGAGTEGGFAVAVSRASSTLSFEGATIDDHETSFRFIDPSTDNTIVFPDVSGTVITSGNLIDMTNNLRNLL